jgi:hypothetical protein
MVVVAVEMLVGLSGKNLVYEIVPIAIPRDLVGNNVRGDIPICPVSKRIPDVSASTRLKEIKVQRDRAGERVMVIVFMPAQQDIPRELY